jgi:uncharacterized protein (DUF1697 family)
MRWLQSFGLFLIAEWSRLPGMSKYAAFLRGINLGKRQIKMADLKSTLERMGLENVKTILASGNVIFTSSGNSDKLKREIEAEIKRKFRFDVHVLLRTGKEMAALVKKDPFKSVKLTPHTRLYITFLSEAPKSKLKVPYKKGDFTLQEITKTHLVSILGPKTSSPDVMDFLGKEFGKEITTRNWNTIIKIHKAMA